MEFLFEFDLTKSKSNKDKHGIDFEEAQRLWLDNPIIVPATSDGEERWAAIGALEGKFWTAFFTMRGEVIRLISVRRARSTEIEKYNDS